MAHDVSDFQLEVLEKSRTVPVVCDFWADWCGPCRVLGPVLERLAAEAGGRWVLAKVDTQQHPEVAGEYGVMSIPNVKLFVDGKVMDEFLGALPEARVREWLERAIPSPHAAGLARAHELMARGAFGEAEAALRGVLEAEPRNAKARLALAECLLHSDPALVADALAGLSEEAELHDKVEAVDRLATWLGALERPASLPEGPGRAPFTAALEMTRAGDWDAALRAVVATLQAERGYAGGAAREFGRALIVRLGHTHPAVERNLRAFASAINV
jgi:putative thioredoxin